MRIAVVTATFPPDIGGMGQVAFEEAKGMHEKGQDVTVFTLCFPGTEYKDHELPFRIKRIKPFLMGGNAGLVPSLRKELKHFDLVHLHFPFYGGAEWVLSSGVPYVVTYHMDADPSKHYQKFIKFFYDRLFSVRILQKAKRVIIVDENHDFKWKSELFPEQMAVLPNAIDTNVFTPGEKDEYAKFLGLQNNKVFLFVGNLMPIKGLGVLLKAIKQLPSDHHLLVVGGGYSEDVYRRQAKELGIEDRVTWLGPCYDKSKLAKYYNLSDAVVVPSYSESFSLVAGEAMSSGKPVIASDIAGVKGRVMDGVTGFLFEKGSTESLVSAIQRFDVMDELQKLKMGESARDLILMKYNMEKHLSTLFQIYQNIL